MSTVAASSEATTTTMGSAASKKYNTPTELRDAKACADFVVAKSQVEPGTTAFPQFDRSSPELVQKEMESIWLEGGGSCMNSRKTKFSFERGSRPLGPNGVPLPPPTGAEEENKQGSAKETAVALPKPQLKAHSAPLANRIKPQRCHLNSDNVFAQAVSIAFFQHYPLSFAPDAVWLAIMQGFALHVKENSEALRSKFVSHEGKEKITILDPTLTFDSPPEQWGSKASVFQDEIVKRLNGNIGKDLFTCKFSTTTFDSAVATSVCLMDCMQNYFEYVMLCGCGIPRIILKGTPEDWRLLCEQVDKLRGFGDVTDAWAKELKLVLTHFATAAAGGDLDQEFWSKTCTCSGGSGMPVLYQGWINVFFPYIESGRKGLLNPNPCISMWREKNEGGEEGSWQAKRSVQPDSFPSGISSAPVLMTDLRDGKNYNLDFKAGFVGVCQDPKTLAVSAEVGWGIVCN